MPADPRGRWFRVYARQVRQHPKFRDLTGIELGAWLALRSEAELRDDAVFADQNEAVLILRRRKVAAPKTMLQRLIDLRLFDSHADGTITVHDRDDHDRPRYPSDDPDEVRRRKQAERERRRAEGDGHEGHDSVTSRDIAGSRGSHEPRAREPQPTEPAPALSTQPTEPAPALSTQPAEPDAGEAGLPEYDDPFTVACRKFVNGGRWLSDAAYRQAWDDLTRRFGRVAVLDEIPVVFERLSPADQTKPWTFVKQTEFSLAEQVRSEELAAERARAAADQRRAREHQKRIAVATPEEREQAEYQKRAIRIALERRLTAPTDASEVREFVRKHDPDFTPGVAA